MIFFSGIFPLAKTITAAIIFRQGAQPSPKLAQLLNLLGKWSMLDVFLAALADRDQPDQHLYRL